MFSQTGVPRNKENYFNGFLHGNNVGQHWSKERCKRAVEPAEGHNRIAIGSATVKSKGCFVRVSNQQCAYPSIGTQGCISAYLKQHRMKVRLADSCLLL